MGYKSLAQTPARRNRPVSYDVRPHNLTSCCARGFRIRTRNYLLSVNATMNKSSQHAIFVACTLATVVIICHSPWTGYETEIPASYISPIQMEALCPGYMRLRSTPLQTMTLQQLLENSQELQKNETCANQYRGEARSISIISWRSNMPLISWFGSLINSVAVLSAIAFLSVVWMLINRSTTSTNTAK